MSVTNLGAFLRFEANSTPMAGSVSVLCPEGIHHKDPHSPSAMELDAMPVGVGAHYDGPSRGSLERPTSAATNRDEIELSKTPNELEMSRPTSPKRGLATEVVQTWSKPSMNKWRVLNACFFCFGNGLNDSGKCPRMSYITLLLHLKHVIKRCRIAQSFAVLVQSRMDSFMSRPAPTPRTAFPRSSPSIMLIALDTRSSRSPTAIHRAVLQRRLCSCLPHLHRKCHRLYPRCIFRPCT